MTKNGDSQLMEANQSEIKTDPNSMLAFATKTAESLFNHVASYATTIPGVREQVVPVSAIESWYNNFRRKLENITDFWMNPS